MTGRELIMFILANGLENEELLSEDRAVRELFDFITATEAAIKFGVGITTIEVWHKLGMIKGARIGEVLYISANAENPMKGNGNA